MHNLQRFSFTFAAALVKYIIQNWLKLSTFYNCCYFVYYIAYIFAETSKLPLVGEIKMNIRFQLLNYRPNDITLKYHAQQTEVESCAKSCDFLKPKYVSMWPSVGLLRLPLSAITAIGYYRIYRSSGVSTTIVERTPNNEFLGTCVVR